MNREDFRPESSDVDIIVVFSRSVGIEFIDLAHFLESKINRKLDLVSRKGIKKQYLDAMEKDIVYVWKGPSLVAVKRIRESDSE